MLTLTSSGFWAYVPKFMTAAKFYSVNNVTISTHRNFVEHTVPGRKGSVFQDMGRPAIKIVIDGNLNEGSIMTGLWKPQSSKPMLAALHKLCDEGTPLDFVCDMPALFGVSQVVISDLEASEARGRKYNYDYKLTLKEWTGATDKGMMTKFLKERAKDAGKKLAKKTLIVGLAAGAVTTYAVTKNLKEDLPLVVSLRFSPQRMKVGQTSQVTVVVSDSKGARVEGATVKVTSVKGTETEKEVASGLTTNADGLAPTKFEGKEAGTFTITATASKSGYVESSQKSVVIVDEVPPTP